MRRTAGVLILSGSLVLLSVVFVAAVSGKQAGPLLASPPATGASDTPTAGVFVPGNPSPSITSLPTATAAPPNPDFQGGPAITPRFPSNDPHSITFVEQDVRTLFAPYIASHPELQVEIVAVTFATAAQFEGADSPVKYWHFAPDRVLAVAEFTVKGDAKHNYNIYDAHTGNGLAGGVA
jgi:hypothetical protein